MNLTNPTLAIVGKDGDLYREFDRILTSREAAYYKSIPWDATYGSDLVAIFVGSKEELPELIKFSEERDVPYLLQMGRNDEVSGMRETICVRATTFSLPLLALARAVEDFEGSIKPMRRMASIAEDFPMSMASPSLMASRLADRLGLKHDSLSSLRYRKDLPASQEVKFYLQGATVSFSFDTDSYDTYVEGALRMAERVHALRDNLHPGIIEADELMFTDIYEP